MKKLFFILSVLVGINANAQLLPPPKEAVDWENAKTYTVEKFDLNSKEVQYNCTDCKILELKTKFGITGYYVVGEASFTTTNTKKIHNAGVALFKFNPADKDTLITLTNPVEFDDKNFRSSSVAILKCTAFRRSYHDGMDIFIPNKNDFSAVFFTEKGEEILISISTTYPTIYYNFSNRKKLDKY